MVRIARVLCPIDFSDASHRALAAATRLARWYDAGVDAVHVAPVRQQPPSAIATTAVDDNAWRLARLDAFIRELGPAARSVAPVLVHGETVPAILDTARTRAADLVVVGTRDRRRSPGLALGLPYRAVRARSSITDALMREAACPLLAGGDLARVCARPGDAPFRSVLLAVDLSSSSLAAVEYALSLAQEAQGRIILLHVLEWASDRFMEPPPAAVHMAWLYLSDDLRNRLRGAVSDDARQWCDVQEQLAIGDPAEEILKAATTHDADVIVMGAGRLRPSERWSSGGRTRQDVLRGATCPVLVVPEEDRAAAVAASASRNTDAQITGVAG